MTCEFFLLEAYTIESFLGGLEEAYFVDAKPSAATTHVIDVLAWKSHLPIASFVFHLADNTPYDKKSRIKQSKFKRRIKMLRRTGALCPEMCTKIC